MRYLLVGLLFLAGCSPSVAPSQSPPVGSSSAPSVAGSASPSPTCSPIGGMAAPCSPDEYAKVEAQNKLVNEAIAVYRRWNKESNRLYRAGGTLKVTPEMEATTTDQAQKSALALFRDLRAGGVRAVSGSAKLVSIGPRDAEVKAGEVALKTCVDGTSFRFAASGKTISRGVVATEQLLLKPVDGQLKLSWVRAVKAEKCTVE